MAIPSQARPESVQDGVETRRVEPWNREPDREGIVQIPNLGLIDPKGGESRRRVRKSVGRQGP